LLTGILASRPPAEAVRGVAAVLKDLREGLVFLFTHAALRFVVLATVATIFAVGVFDALVAIYVRDILRSDARIFGALVAIIGVGTILGSTAVGRFGQRISRVQMVALGIGGCGLGVGLLAAAGTATTALAASFFLGWTVAAVFIPSQTLTQEETPAGMLGRVSSTSFALITVSQLLGVAVSGKLAEWLGIRNLYYAVAVAVVLVGVIGYAYARAYHVGEKRVLSTEPAPPGL
jgi:MFS family permease